MRRRKLPHELTARLRQVSLRASLGAALSLVGAGGAGAAGDDLPSLAPAASPSQAIRQSLPAEPSHALAFEVRGEGEGRLVFGALRSTAPLAAVSLLDPTGRRLWRRTPAELGLVLRAQAQAPELGDALPLPEVRNPAPGRWQLLLERAAPDTAPARVLLSYSFVPRHVLALWAAPGSAAVGEPVLVTLRASDFGAPAGSLPALPVRVLDAAGQPEAQFQAQADAHGPSAARISTEPGTYVASWAPARPGPHTLEARWQPLPDRPALVVTRDVAVRSGLAQIRFTGAQPDIAAGCLKSLSLAFDVRLDATPPPGATHAFAAQVRGEASQRLLSTSIALSGREGQARLKLDAAALRTLGWPLQRIESPQVTRLVPGIQVLHRGEAIDLAPVLASLPQPCP